MNIYKQRAIKRLFGDNAIKHNDDYTIYHLGNDIESAKKKLDKIYDFAEDYTNDAWDERTFLKNGNKMKKDLEDVSKSLINIAQKWYKETLDMMRNAG